jgi:hypothetical protein
LVKVLDRVRANSVSRIGFVKYDTAAKRWCMVEDAAARITIAQHFRDALHDDYRSSKQYKQKRRQEEKDEEIKSETSSVATTAAAPVAKDLNMSMNMSRAWKRQRTCVDHFSFAASPDATVSSFAAPSSSSNIGSDLKARLQSILQDATALIDDNQEVDGDETFASFNFFDATPISMAPNAAAPVNNDFFSSLYGAVASDLDMASDPFEPTPIGGDEQSLFEPTPLADEPLFCGSGTTTKVEFASIFSDQREMSLLGSLRNMPSAMSA